MQLDSTKKLTKSPEGKKILNDFNITINEGEVHAIMGPNGCGKSTLANVLAGNEEYEVNSGKIIFKDEIVFPVSSSKLNLCASFVHEKGCAESKSFSQSIDSK